MSQKLTLEYINREQKTSKEGKPYTSVSIQAREYPNVYLTGFGSGANQNWQVGQTVEVEEVTKKDYNGRTYYNFKMPQGARGMSNLQIVELLQKINEQLKVIADYVSSKRPNQGGLAAATLMPQQAKPVTLAQPSAPAKLDMGYEYPEPGVDGEIDPDSIPF